MKNYSSDKFLVIFFFNVNNYIMYKNLYSILFHNFV